MDLVTLVRRGAQQFSDRCAVACEGETQTYERLYERSCRLANALAALGVQRGERVATFNDNRLESVELMAGVALGGFVRTALYTHGSPESNLYLLNLVEASALIVEARHHEALAPHLQSAPGLRHVLVLGGPAPDGTLDYDQALAGAGSGDPRIR